MILFCKCESSDLVSVNARIKISYFLEKSCLEYIEVTDFCNKIALSESWIKTLAASSTLSVIACYPRAVEWLFHAAGVSIKEKNITYFNMREQKADDIISEISQNSMLKKGTEIVQEISNKSVGWFPVIDYNRCSNCGQCMDFCLFGVYERMQDKSIKVANPGNCKENCPACARICPHVAIMFPKLSEKPINGAEVGDVAADNKNLQLDIKDMLGDDVYTALAARKKRSKKKLLKAQNMNKAEAEKAQCAANFLKPENKKCSCPCDCSFTAKNTK